MNFLDIIIALPLCYFIFKGWRRGLIFEIAALLSILVGCWACVHFSTWVAEALNLKGDGAVLVAFFITFAGVVAGAYFLGKAIEGVFKMVKLNFVNKILGAFFGMAKALCILSILLNFVIMVDQNEVILTQNVKQESKLFNPAYKIGNKLTLSLKDYISQKREDVGNKLSEQK